MTARGELLESGPGRVDRSIAVLQKRIPLRIVNDIGNDKKNHPDRDRQWKIELRNLNR